MTWRRWRWLLPACLLSITAVPAIAQAHILREDNGIAAELHIPPDDRPTAGRLTKLTFAFGSDRPGFALINCDCRVIATKSNLTTAAVRLRADPPQSPVDAAADINFPEAGDYQLVLTGTATNGSFGSFRLSYPAHVAKPYAPSGSNRAGLWLIGLTTLFTAVGILTSVVLRNRKALVSRGKRSPD